VVFYLCSQDDRGHAYCSEPCRAAGRARTRRAANARGAADAAGSVDALRPQSSVSRAISR